MKGRHIRIHLWLVSVSKRFKSLLDFFNKVLMLEGPKKSPNMYSIFCAIARPVNEKSNFKLMSCIRRSEL